MRIEFYGASDDLIEIRVNGKDYEEVSGYISGDKSVYSRELRVTTIGGSQGIKVHMLYDGCWTAAAGLLEEDRSLPAGWKITTEQEHAYSTKLVINTGDDQVLITNNKGKPIKGEQHGDDDE